jgi:hypothetical protein
MRAAQLIHPLEHRRGHESLAGSFQRSLIETPTVSRGLPTPIGPAFPPPEGPHRIPPTGHRWRKFGVIGAIVALLAGAAIALVMLLMPRAEFVADSLDAPESIVEGEILEVDMHVRNTGRGDGERDITLLDNGVAADTVTVALAGKAETDETFRVRGLTAGTHEFSVEGWAELQASVYVMTPAEFVVDDITVSPTEVNVGGEVSVIVQYSNIGEADGSYTLRVEFDDRMIEERTVELEGNTAGEATFAFTAEGRGSMVVSVNDQPQRIQVLAPAEFVIDGLDVSPNPANVNALLPVTVAVRLSNIGDVEGVHTVDFMIDNLVVESRSVTVSGGQSAEELFTFVPNHPGIHVLGVAGQTVELDVFQLQRPDNGTVFVNELGGGSNRLKIDNQRSKDMLVVLTDPADPSRQLLSVYVHANSTSTVRGIRSGTYTTFYSDGSDWCVFYQRFTLDPDYGRFQDDSVFTASGSTYTIVTLTFGATDGAWSPTSNVDPDDFPK